MSAVTAPIAESSAPLIAESQAAPAPGAMSSRDRRKLGGEALIYLLGMVLGRAASLIMLPVYTRLLSPADYGVLQLLDMTSDVVAILVSAGCTAGVMRFYFKANTDEGRRAVLGSALALQLSLNLIGSCLLVIFAEPIWLHVLHGAQRKELVYLAAANFTLGSLSVVPLVFMQIEKRALQFSMISVVRLLSQLSGNIVFLVVLGWGPAGILTSSLIVNVFLGGACAIWMIRRMGLVVTRSALLDLRRFGLPYQVATLGTFVVTFGDRLFLDKYEGLAVVGLYSLAYQFGFMLDQVGIAPFMRAWTPRRFESAHEPREIRDAKNEQGFRYLNLLAFTCAAGIAAFVGPTLRVMSHREFWQAAEIVPIILSAYIVQGWVAVLEIAIDISEHTRYVTYSVWASVIASLVFYALLIPPYGSYGAAWATLLSFLVRLAFHWHFSKKVFPLRYGWGSILRLAGCALIPGSAVYFSGSLGLAADIALAVLLFSLYVAAVWVFVLGTSDRRAIVAFGSARLKALTLRAAAA